MPVVDEPPPPTSPLEEPALRELVEGAPDAMVIVDAAGVIRLVNAEAERLFGYSRAELIGAKVEVLIPGRFGDHERHRDRYVAEPRARRMDDERELYGLRKDGTEFPVEISLTPLATPRGLLVTSAIRDITERKRLEDALRRASRAKTELLATMSHELRTPLNAIIGLADLMHRGRTGPLADDQRAHLGDILTSARHLLQLINDVLDLAKVEAGKMEYRPEPLDLPRLVTEVRDVVRGLAAQRRLRLELEVAPDLDVVADAARLKQVLFNFLSNAIKFSREGGVITVRARAEGADAFRVEVEDRGIGIASDDLARLCGEFEQLDAGRSRRAQGSGLGLAVTRRILEGQRGRIEVTSALGVGSTFAAILPRRPPPEA